MKRKPAKPAKKHHYIYILACVDNWEKEIWFYREFVTARNETEAYKNGQDRMIRKGLLPVASDTHANDWIIKLPTKRGK